MARVLRREAAKRDLIAHFVYLGKNASTEVAERFLRAAEQAGKSLAQMPEIGIPGKVQRGKYAGVRIWPVPGFDKYLIVYRPDQRRSSGRTSGSLRSRLSPCFGLTRLAEAPKPPAPGGSVSLP